ncbi:hypothetical protein NEHOM01_2530, partial [Nematocida homosporus]|uniref:uncharacterized protein n=1 Tax=Nematocida homosporus TaxID=1912981 RepID=UPI00221F70B8
LRRITVFKADFVRISAHQENIMKHHTNLVLLCRLLNMFECNKLLLWTRDNKVSNESKCGFDPSLCRKEAEDTVKYAGAVPFDFEIRAYPPPDVFQKDIFEGLVILRPISQLSLFGSLVPNLSAYLERLSLSKDWHLIIEYSQEKVSIDLKSIRNAAPNCAKITFILKDSRAKEPKITGLETISNEDLPLVLTGDFKVIKYIAEHNMSSIHVHAVSYDGFDTIFTEYLDKLPNTAPASKPHVFAQKFICGVSIYSPCDSPVYYKQVLSRKYLVKYGIDVQKVQIEYDKNRNDLLDGLTSLYNVNALLRIPADIEDKKIVCLGHALSAPYWKLEEPVNLKLKNFRIQIRCQNICYTSLSVSGDKNPRWDQVVKCDILLDELRSINAQELRISDVHDHPPTVTDFDLAKLKTNLDSPLKYSLNVGTLILDNVDEC